MKFEIIEAIDPVSGAIYRKRTFKGHRAMVVTQFDECSPVNVDVAPDLATAHARAAQACRYPMNNAVGYAIPANVHAI